jgi:hypothetical protein
MKVILLLTIWLYVLLNLDISYSQQIYFNNRYNLCQNYNEEAWSGADGILQVDVGYIVAGFTVDTITYWWRRIPIIKLNNGGEQIMYKSYGDTIADYYTGFSGSMKKAATGNNYYIVGSKNYWQPVNYDVGFLMKFNDQLDTLWTKEYNLNQDCNRETSLILNNIELCDNHDLILSGSMNGSYMFLMRTDSSGNERWHKSFHYGGNTLCTGFTAIQTSDGGFALGGFQYTIGQEETGNPVIVKTDSLGNQQWVKYMGGPLLDYRAFLAKSIDNNIIMGSTYGIEMVGHDARSRINIAKLDNNGNVIWDKKYGETHYRNYLLNINVMQDGKIIACGCNPGVYSSGMGWIIKVNENGDSLWYREYALLTGTNSINRLRAVIETSDNGLAACGDIIPMPPDTGIREAWVIKLDSNGCEWAGCDSTVGIEEHGGMEAWWHGEMEVWPNPARTWITITLPYIDFSGIIELAIYDIFGQEVMYTRINPQNRTVSLNISALSSGLYLAVCKDVKKQVIKGKFVVIR